MLESMPLDDLTLERAGRTDKEDPARRSASLERLGYGDARIEMPAGAAPREDDGFPLR
jgi:hypothetical protein